MIGGDVLRGPITWELVRVEHHWQDILATKRLPQINNTDHGIWRRIQAIPFNRTFTAEEQDKDLGVKLAAELPRILNWAIQGCLEWQEQSLNPPQVVLDQVSAYKTEMDSITQFVEQSLHSSSQTYVAIYMTTDSMPVLDWLA